MDDVIHMRGFMSNALGEMIGIIVFGLIGRVKNGENNQRKQSKKNI